MLRDVAGEPQARGASIRRRRVVPCEQQHRNLPLRPAFDALHPCPLFPAPDGRGAACQRPQGARGREIDVRTIALCQIPTASEPTARERSQTREKPVGAARWGGGGRTGRERSGIVVSGRRSGAVRLARAVLGSLAGLILERGRTPPWDPGPGSRLVPMFIWLYLSPKHGCGATECPGLIAGPSCLDPGCPAPLAGCRTTTGRDGRTRRSSFRT